MVTRSKTAWALGLPLESTRPFTAQELNNLRQAVKRYRVNTLLFCIAYPLAWAIFGLLASQVPSDSSVAQGFLSVAAIGLVLVGLPSAILLSKDSLRRARQLAKEVKHGQVLRFVGPITEECTYDPAFSKLVGNDLIKADQRAKLAVEVLAGSSRIWAVNEVSTKSWIEVYVADVADVPPDAATATEWLPMEESEASERVGKRKLMDEEKVEMTQHARRSWKRPLPWTIGFTIWISMPIAVMIGQGHLDHPSYYIQMLFVGIATVGAYVAQAKGLAMAKTLGRDRDDGEVMVIEINGAQELPNNGESVGQDYADNESGAPHASNVIWGEMLIHTSIMWSENGQAAAWRKGS